MQDTNLKQKLIISGVGGQGVLFITRLLAQVAIEKELPVITAETHGMAQRGGTVISHLKVGAFSSPMIRQGSADGLLILKGENLAAHESFLKPGGWMVVNSPAPIAHQSDFRMFLLDGDRIAQQIGNPKAVNLVLLGAALAVIGGEAGESNGMFCTLADMESMVENQWPHRQDIKQANLTAIHSGFQKMKLQ